MPYSLAVIICSHNPRPDYLAEVLAALKAQDLPQACWQLILVDNKSDTPLAGLVDLGWHTNALVVREEELGLVHARLRGIAEAQSDLLVFVDDDNVLDPSYLYVVLRIAASYSWIGAWGGQQLPRFETPPPRWLTPYLCMLALQNLDADVWQLHPYDFRSVPAGAGLCVRPTVGEEYVRRVRAKPVLTKLGRVGELLTSCEDYDMAFTACDLGFGTALFKDLVLTHLIPSSRLEASYLVRLLEGIGYSSTLLRGLRGLAGPPEPSVSFARRLARRLCQNGVQRQMHRAYDRGGRMAVNELRLLAPGRPSGVRPRCLTNGIVSEYSN